MCVNLGEKISFKEQLAFVYFNKGLCFNKMNETDKAIECFKKAIENDNKYTKAYLNRMLLYYKKEDYIEALDGNIFLLINLDFNKLKELDLTLYSQYKNMEYELNYKAEIKKKQMTDEMLGKMKEVGNSFLGLFGLSTDNFKVQQGQGGGYSIQFQK